MLTYLLWGFLILFIYTVIGVIVYRLFDRFSDYSHDDSLGCGFLWIVSVPIHFLLCFIQTTCKIVDSYIDRFTK